MEDGDSVRHLNYDCSTDCNEHHFVHGTWSYLYVRLNPSIRGVLSFTAQRQGRMIVFLLLLLLIHIAWFYNSLCFQLEPLSWLYGMASAININMAYYSLPNLIFINFHVEVKIFQRFASSRHHI